MKILFEELEKFSKGLYSARTGDMVIIGVEGEKEKRQAKVKKITKNDEIIVTGDHVFDRKGFLKRRGSSSTEMLYPDLPVRGKTKRVIYASLMTKEEADETATSMIVDLVLREIKSKRKELTREKAEKLLSTLGDLVGTRYSAGTDHYDSRFSKKKIKESVSDMDHNVISIRTDYDFLEESLVANLEEGLDEDLHLNITLSPLGSVGISIRVTVSDRENDEILHEQEYNVGYNDGITIGELVEKIANDSSLFDQSYMV
jgi:hypothetical protein